MGAEISILIVLIILNAFFAASEIALISLNDNKIKLMADAGDKKSIMIYKLLKEPSRFLATIQIGITLAGFLASAFAADGFAGPIAEFLYNIGIPLQREVLGTISVFIVTILLSYFTLVLGELVPKQLALKKAEAISNFAVGPLTILSKITSPFVKFLTLSMNAVLRLFGIDPNAVDDNEVTEEEIRMMVTAGNEKGTIQESEKEMIDNIFDFDNKIASDVMTHRTNIEAISIDSSLKDTVHFVNIKKHTRFPVYENDIDHIVGILHAKDLIQYLDDEGPDGETFHLRDLIRSPFFVLASTKIDHLFQDMQKNSIHMAIAMDEYGGTDGIVTMEDLIEEIVGNIFDEYDDPKLEEEIIELDENTYLMDGTINLYEVEDVLNINLPIEDFDTLSGFMIGSLGYIPTGESKPSIEFGNATFTVEKTDSNRILQILVRLKGKSDKEE